MGDVADMMLDGTLCEQCGVALDGDSPGYPRKCDGCACDSIEDIELTGTRRMLSDQQHVECRALAHRHGLVLTQHSHAHYAISPKDGRWLLNFYPGNGRLYGDPNKPERAPYLDMAGRKPSLMQVVEAIAERLI